MSVEKEQPTRKRRRTGAPQCCSTDTRVLAQQQRSRRDNHYYHRRRNHLYVADAAGRLSFGNHRQFLGDCVPKIPLVLLLSLTFFSLGTTIGPLSCHAWSSGTHQQRRSSSSFQLMISLSPLPSTNPQLVFGSYASRRQRSVRLFANVETAETKMEHEQLSSSDVAERYDSGTVQAQPERNGTQQTISTAHSTAVPVVTALLGTEEHSNTIEGIPSEIANSEVVSSGSLLSSNYSTTTPDSTEDMSLPSFLQDDEEDSPKPTANGGFTHTRASRAKISAANKGKTPWNKGRKRSEETRARIAAGVRARNRERFLQKLKDMGVTEAEYEAQKAAERRRKDAERRARRTSKGGYRPTEETKRKISEILKQKHAAGEIKRRNIDPAKVRRGFTHSEETRRKISESLRRRWASDPDYRQRMIQLSNVVNTRESTRQKISASLRAKWKDPAFRAGMLEKFANRTSTTTSKGGSGQRRSEEHRQKISAAMKAKWQDEAYRQKNQAAIKKRQATAAEKTAVKPAEKKRTSSTSSNSSTAKEAATIRPVLPRGLTDPVTLGQVRLAQPLAEPRTPGKRRKRRAAAAKKQAKAVQPKKRPNTNDSNVPAHMALNNNNDGDPIDIIDDILADLDELSPKKQASTPSSRTRSRSSTGSKANGSVDLLKQHRRDLYDLLYGDESTTTTTTMTNGGNSNLYLGDDGENGQEMSTSSGTNKLFALEDENLDNFDPYGLEDF